MSIIETIKDIKHGVASGVDGGVDDGAAPRCVVRRLPTHEYMYICETVES